jgi:hypothetical protein
VAIGFAVFGKRLLGGAPPQRSAQSQALPAAPPTWDSTGSTDQAMLANRPVTANAPAPISAPVAPPVATAPPVAAATNAEPATSAETTEEAAASADGTAAAGGAQAEAAASPESRLAAQGARHAIAGRYAEALPVYRELARTYSQNTAYTAMAHVLEQKLDLAPGAAPAPANP